jgi:hypothetical protein
MDRRDLELMLESEAVYSQVDFRTNPSLRIRLWEINAEKHRIAANRCDAWAAEMREKVNG